MGFMTSIDVRSIEAHEWERLREIRLEALADTPTAFITTLDEARAFPDSVWIDRASAGASGEDQRTVLAIDGADTVGMSVGLFRPHARSGVVPIVSVYVSPRARRDGTGTRLMQDLEAWARTKGASMTSLWVVDTNEVARRFYERLGYVATLDRQKITVPPVRWETRLVKDLSG